MSMISAGYRRKGAIEKARIIVEMPKAELEALDAWGVPAGMKSRTAAIRALIRKGLEAVGAPAAGQEA